MPTINITPGAAGSLPISGAGSPPLSWSLQNAPAWMGVNAASGNLFWNPPAKLVQGDIAGDALLALSNCGGASTDSVALDCSAPAC